MTEGAKFLSVMQGERESDHEFPARPIREERYCDFEELKIFHDKTSQNLATLKQNLNY